MGVQTLRRVLNTVFPVLLGSLMLFAAAPGSWWPEWTKEPREAFSRGMRTVSLGQVWKMYAPGAARAHTYLNVTAIYPDGSERSLVETAQEKRGWGTTAFWRKTRLDIARYRVSGRKGVKPDRNRSWYLRGVCVREARRDEPAPVKLVAERVKRKVRPPHKVRAGKKTLSKKQRKKLDTMSCRAPLVLKMIAADRERHRGGG